MTALRLAATCCILGSLVACAPVAPEAESPPSLSRVPAPDDLPRDRSLRAGFLIVDGVYNSELMAPYDIFHHTPFHTDPAPGIEVLTISPDIFHCSRRSSQASSGSNGTPSTVASMLAARSSA